MHSRQLFTCFCFAALALPAMAQQSVSGMDVGVPAISETEEAAPDWYRQFTFGSAADENPVWKALPSRELGIAWTKGDRWSLNVDLSRHDEGTPLPHEEMSAGATFKITPRISVGGKLSVGARRLDDDNLLENEQVETGIRLQSAFKF